nr:class I SAM-dependent methyltransferase [Chloroflexia bacterium]
MVDMAIDALNRLGDDRDEVADSLLGRAPAERSRLISQGGVFRPLTERLFVAAGLVPGMRVLDLGSGAGDVALLAAEMVGPAGSVVGVDNDPNVLVIARERAYQAGFTNVSFVEGDVGGGVPADTFDALVGRFILMYQSDPAAAIQARLPWLRAGAVIAFHEMDIV